MVFIAIQRDLCRCSYLPGVECWSVEMMLAGLRLDKMRADKVKKSLFFESSSSTRKELLEAGVPSPWGHCEAIACRIMERFAGHFLQPCSLVSIVVNTCFCVMSP